MCHQKMVLFPTSPI